MSPMHDSLREMPAPSDRAGRRSIASPQLEEEWIRRLRAGDAKALEAIFHAYYNRLCLYAERILNSPEFAEDVVSDVFCNIWERRSAWKIHTSLTAYLYTAVRNRALRQIRHKRVVDRQVELSVPGHACPGMGEPTPMPDEQLEAVRLAGAVERTLTQLPERAREAFVLQRSHGLSYEQVGAVMGISVSTVEKHMIRAIRVLRDRLSGWQ